MANELSTKLVHIDYKFIRDNYLNRDLWGKKWVIYKYGRLKVTMILHSINCVRMTAMLGLLIEYSGNKKRHYNSYTRSRGYFDYESDGISIPLDNPEYNDTLFQNKIYGTIKDELCDLERYGVIQRTARYRAEFERIEWYNDQLERRATEFLDEQGIKNEEIREAYISYFKNKHSYGYSSLRDIENEMEYNLLTEEFLLFASFNNKEDDVKLFSEIASTRRFHKSTILTWIQKQKDCEELENIECPSLADAMEDDD